jgi:type I restriction enzyme, S subunit
MSKSWPMVPLGEALTHRKEFVRISDMDTYKRCRVQLHAKGIVLRDIVSGAEIKTKEQQVGRAGEFLVAEIDAKVGGFGVVPDDLDGSIVSSHYFLFEINEEKLDRRFLDYFARTPCFRDQVGARGSTNYAAIRPHQVLQYQIPLPPLSEQRWIVARIDDLAAKIEEARCLREHIRSECNALCGSILFSRSNGSSTLTKMRELLRLKETDVLVYPNETYCFAGVYCFGGGVFKGNQKQGFEFSYSRLTRLRSGDFVYPKLMAWEGALGAVPPECDGLVVSPEFPVFEVSSDRALPDTLDVYFRTPSVWPLLAEISTGTNVRRRRLHPKAFLEFEIPLPPISVQQQLRQARERMAKIKQLHTETATELDAMLPSVLDRAFKGGLL